MSAVCDQNVHRSACLVGLASCDVCVTPMVMGANR